ncbi:MAG: PorV/PorQ family protein [Candidatus Latescibacteria bacterium]|nr:PorV/PorQ family protein [Candidatus Latescibacterota bacterium]NIM21591.1 PorV/PorQ family protein [Candidatus Latescibacterota bacterium]NIM64570.1 PorV/PorQ family protein [Candidatus Latescibacterota bacterium]NIO01085.1 PorV/PorQ family protein [Candidatus Latescibacterota bacterium]NIO27478.1 PorV/PorQ family protein [Candidatus Latescibacterota bacterium]
MRRTIALLIITPALAFSYNQAIAGDPGDAGALFLRIGLGARASGMGEAFVGVAEDASSVYWNPGAMAAVLGTNALAMHNEYLHSLRLEQLALTHETDYGTIGLGFTGLYMDELERRGDSPTSVPLGTFSAYDVAVTVGFSRYIFPNLSAGIAVKPVYQKIDEESAIGVAFDVGVYHIARMPGVKFAAVITNVGKPMKFVSEEYALPREIKIGGSYERRVPAARGKVLFTLDVLFPNDGDIKEHAGFEYGYTGRLFLRAGYKAGYDSFGATFGLGVKYKKLIFDYAFLLVDNDLGDSHRLGVGFTL